MKITISTIMGKLKIQMPAIDECYLLYKGEV